jgi:cytochrome b subunit of formate dehydrogenase
MIKAVLLKSMVAPSMKLVETAQLVLIQTLVVLIVLLLITGIVLPASPAVLLI